jgi:hypothetical protein
VKLFYKNDITNVLSDESRPQIRIANLCLQWSGQNIASIDQAKRRQQMQKLCMLTALSALLITTPAAADNFPSNQTQSICNSDRMNGVCEIKGPSEYTGSTADDDTMADFKNPAVTEKETLEKENKTTEESDEEYMDTDD